MASKLTITELTARAVVAQAARACRGSNCGVEGRGNPGGVNYMARCADCPMDDVDDLWDAMMAAPSEVAA